MRDAGREHVALETVARVEEPWGRVRPSRRSAARRREAGQRLARQVEPVRQQSQCLLTLGRVLGLREHLARANERLLPIGRALDLEPHAIDEVALGAPQPLGEALGRIGRILALRKRDDLDVESLRPLRAPSAQRRLLAGGVRVEAEEQLLRQSPELAELPLGQRRAHGRDDRLEARPAAAR